jgi:hypothetical protein
MTGGGGVALAKFRRAGGALGRASGQARREAHLGAWGAGVGAERMADEGVRRRPAAVAAAAREMAVGRGNAGQQASV